MIYTISKTGQGAFSVEVGEDGLTTVNGRHTFPTPRAAYDHYYPNAASGIHSAWNICYFLEDIVPEFEKEEAQ